ncbi:hypothetical protein LTS08_005993 [Lithohypha guttulata]|uniref:uncharacterized protein n=1 Tax=Lithohypha guttulata TaxID=1690604 RepID=UPI002DE08AA5|nr:hypothetical protein LTR51_002507 [Lithohypha guttulata]KAK5099411.1 hypothetical protein LTS08_005993 [Lithohypha guttulata]
MASTMTNYISPKDNMNISPKDTINHISPKDTMSSTSSCDYTEISISSITTQVWWTAVPCCNTNCLRCKRSNPLQSPKGEEVSNGSVINNNHEVKLPNPLLQSPKGETANNSSINYTAFSTPSSKPNPLLQPPNQSASNGNTIAITTNNNHNHPHNHTHTHNRANTHTHTNTTTTIHLQTPNPFLSNPLVFDPATKSDTDQEEDFGYTSEDSDTSTIKAPIQITKTPLYHYHAAINAIKQKKIKSVKKQKAQVVQMMTMMKEVLEREEVTQMNGRMNLKKRFLEMARRELGLKTGTERTVKEKKQQHHRWGRRLGLGEKLRSVFD